jgi:hypothetical protein
MRPTLLVFMLIATPALSAEEPPVGARVRVSTSDVVEVPGVGRIDAGSLRLNGIATPERNTVTVKREGALPLTLPRANSRYAGEVVASDADTLTIRLDGRDLRVSLPRTAIARMELSRGRRPRSTLRGAAIGAGIGAAGGALLGFAAGGDRCPPGRPGEGFFGWQGCLALFSAGDKAAMGAVGFGALGGLVGAVIGSQRAERWETVTTHGTPKVRVSLRPLGRLGASLALGF